MFIYSLFGYCWYFSSTLLCSSWLCAYHFKNNPDRGAAVVTITMRTNIPTLSKNARIISNHVCVILPSTQNSKNYHWLCFVGFCRFVNDKEFHSLVVKCTLLLLLLFCSIFFLFSHLSNHFRSTLKHLGQDIDTVLELVDFPSWKSFWLNICLFEALNSLQIWLFKNAFSIFKFVF